MRCKTIVPSNAIHPPPVAYVDTLAVLLPARPDSGLLNDVRAACGSVASKRSRRRGWWRITIHQPRPAAIHTLAAVWGDHKPTPCVSGLDAALDIPAATEAEAAAMGLWVNRHVLQPYRRERTITYCKGTRYNSPTRWGRGKVNEGGEYEAGRGTTQIVTYSDRRSKATGTPCLHIEMRHTGARQVRRAGIRHPADLLTLDLRAWWSQRLVLAQIDPVEITRQAQRRRRSDPSDFYKATRVWNLIRRGAAEDEDGKVSAQSMHDACRGARWYRPTTALPKIDSTDFLPPIQEF